MEGGVEEADLYESLPEKATVGTYMLAGAMAGMGEHCVMYPFDCVKVRQSISGGLFSSYFYPPNTRQLWKIAGTDFL